MKTVVREYHRVNLTVMNFGPNAITSDAAAYAMNELVQPAAIIVSHPNEGVTSGGKLKSRHAHKRFHRAGQGQTGLPRDQRAHDGVRRQRELRSRLLVSLPLAHP